jgi:hypothetical protein
MVRPYEQFDEDFGLSGLTKYFRYPTPLPGEEEAVGLVELIAGHEEGDYAVQLLEDVQRLLESPLCEETLLTVWLAATRRYFDPGEHGLDGRIWLRRIADACVAEIRKHHPAYMPLPPGPTTDQVLREDVLAEIREIAPRLTEAVTTSIYAAPLPGAVEALEQVVGEVDVELGFRLFLRTMHAYFVWVGGARNARYELISDRLGHHELLLPDMNLNIWADADD